MVQRRAQQYVPVDTANLKNSAYTEMVGPLIVQVGFTAEYAGIVHEDMEAQHHVGGPKYLERAEKETRRDRLDVLVTEMRR